MMRAYARAVPLVVLVSTVVVATLVRARRPPRPSPSPPRASLKSAPSAREESLPAAVVPGAARVTAGPPTMLHGDAHHTDRAHGHIGPRAEVAWTFVTDGPIEGQVVASADAATLYVATLAGTLWALDRSGKARFHVPLGGRAYGTPCVAPDGTVYVGSDGGAFFAIGRDGRVKWRLETAGDADTGAVLTEDGIVVFAAGSSVYGVRATGALAYRFQAKGKIFTGPATGALAAGETRAFVGAQDHNVYALTPTGALDWSTDLGGDVDGEPAIGDDGALYVGTDGGDVVRLDTAGHVVWRVPVGGYVRGPLSIARNGDVLAGVYGPSPRVVRVSESGVVRGAFVVQGNGRVEVGVHGGPVEDDDGALAFGGPDGVVHAIDVNGKERWQYAAPAAIDAPLTLLPDGSLVVGDYAGNVIVLVGGHG